MAMTDRILTRTSQPEFITKQKAIPMQSPKWARYISTSRNTLPHWAMTLRRSNQTTDELIGLLQTADVIHMAGAFGSGRIKESVDAHIALMDSTPWTHVESLAAKMRAATGQPHRCIWQIGNEISSRAFSESLGGSGRAYDHTIIPALVEYDLVPALAAAAMVKASTGEAVVISTGSVTSCYSPQALAWLKSLLDYEIKGKVGVGFGGRRVRDCVQYFSFHYAILKDEWSAAFDQMAGHIGTGSIVGMLDTEEIGQQLIDGGNSGPMAVEAVTRAVGFVKMTGLTAQQFRLNIWAVGSDDANKALSELELR